jgi:hypothetical protein
MFPRNYVDPKHTTLVIGHENQTCKIGILNKNMHITTKEYLSYCIVTIISICFDCLFSTWLYRE